MSVVIIVNMSAELLNEQRHTFPDSNILEIVIWKVPKIVLGSSHNYKYRLFYGNHAERIVGYDNERPKGDHRHYGDHEEAYQFTGIEQLLTDFYDDVAARRDDL
uniref:Uncharacterized protein n=1 Tax=uncultured Thiotrichaceae bacterium TaxID=298394 RepID=A0A6S6T8P7_9GAMM|nr:MAG: Unknown protein [uncultured Thiotrichaceae bacterium]